MRTQFISDSMRFCPAAIRAAKTLARSKPWRGDETERLAKFRACLAEMLDAYGLDPVTLNIAPEGEEFGDSVNRIIAVSRLSVVTLFHLVARIRGQDGFHSQRFAVNLFRRCFPKSWARCTINEIGHVVKV